MRLLVLSELKKLFSRRMVIIICLLLALNAVLAVIYASRLKAQHPLYYDSGRLALVKAVNNEIKSDTNAAREYYNELSAEYESQFKAWQDTISYELEPQSFEFSAPHTYFEEYNDYEVLKIYFNTVNDYPAIISRLIGEADRNKSMLERFGISDKSATGRYQEEMIDLYENILSETGDDVDLVFGWDEWFGYTNGMIVLYLGVLVLVLQSGLCDRDSDMLMIIRTTERGRKATGAAKLAALFMGVCSLAFVMRLTDLAVLAVQFGLSSPFCAIQNLRSLTYCQYPVSVLSGALINIAGLIVTSLAFALICMTVTEISRNAVVTVVSGAAITGANLLVYWLAYEWRYRFLGYFSLASGELIRKMSDISHIDMGRSLLPHAFVFHLTVICVFTTAFMLITGVFKPRNNAGGKAKKALSAFFRRLRGVISAFLPENRKKRLHKTFGSVSLLNGEAAKAGRSFIILLLLLFVVLRLVNNYNLLTESRDDGEYLKTNLINIFGSEVSAKSLEAMEERIAADSNKLDNNTLGNCISRFVSGDISSDEYYGFLVERSQAQAELPVLSELTAHANYLLALKEDRGIDAELFYDGGYLNLFDRNFDVYILLITVLISAFSYTWEYGADGRSGISKIMRASKRGRRPVYVSKLVFSLLIITILLTLFDAFDFAVFANRFGTAGIGAKLVCIKKYAAFDSSLTVGGYMALYFAVRLIAHSALAVMITSLSCIIPSVRISLPMITGVLLLPLALTYFGVRFCRFTDYTAFLDADRFMLIETSSNAPYALLFVLVISTLAAALGFMSYRKFCK